MPTAIKAENISKSYQLGEIGTGTISRDLERYWAKIRGKEDPFLRIGETNDRTKKGNSDIVWSLKDINFEINQGDAVGIIGRNGAGKSTLLKILSRVTSPTTGHIKVKGRIASLLEVGTGFHPELTGRENIFLNGAILGMRKAEIKKHFDAIVDFSGVERYIDTPVKRYSSGMYVRLAFAVAAHLESEILIVDEVLAVGDAEFQKKCLGKMSDVSKGEGRTVLFVSHNMGAVKELCNVGILLQNGELVSKSNIQDIISQYSLPFIKQEEGEINLKLSGNIFDLVNPLTLKINNSVNKYAVLQPKDSIQIDLIFDFLKELKNFIGVISIFSNGERIFTQRESDKSIDLNIGKYKSTFILPPYLLRPGMYHLAVGGLANNEVFWCWGLDVAQIKIEEFWDDYNIKLDVGYLNLNLETFREKID